MFSNLKIREILESFQWNIILCIYTTSHVNTMSYSEIKAMYCLFFCVWIFSAVQMI